MDNNRNRMDRQTRGRTQVLLLGCNFMNEGKYDRSDSIIVVSLDREKGEVKLASILRDIYVDLHEYGTEKINAALICGGPEYTVQIVNENFGLNIRYYALVDMRGLVNIIDLIGGIDIEITEMERIFLNCWVRDLAMQLKDGIIPPPLEKAGLVHMDGRTAMSHARNRAIGSDFARSDRQRAVLRAMAGKIKENTGPIQRIKLFLRCMKYIKTNLSLPRAAALGVCALKSVNAGIPSIRIPAENTYRVSRDKEWHFEINFEENTTILEQFFAS